MKKLALAQDALELYAEKFMPLNEIAKKLKVNEKTLRRWKKTDNWEEKKYRFIKTQSSLHQDLFKLGRVLLKSIKYLSVCILNSKKLLFCGICLTGLENMNQASLR